MNFGLEKVILEKGEDASVVVATIAPSTVHRCVVGIGEKRPILTYILTNAPNLVNLIRPRKSVIPFGKQPPNIREKLRPFFFRKLGVEGINGDVYRAPVGFEREDAGHDICCGGGIELGGAEGEEIFEVGFVNGVSDDFDVEVVKVGSGEARFEVWGEGCFYQYTLIQFFYIGSNTESRHRLEDAQWMTAFDKLMCISLVQRPGNEKDDVVNHVGVCNIVQKLA
jgi:hypothetical protein